MPAPHAPTNDSAPGARDASVVDVVELGRLHAALATRGAGLDARALIAAATTAARLLRWDDVLTLARAALVVDPAHARAWGLVGQALEQQGQLVEARKACEEGLALDDTDLPLALLTARLQARTGAASQARALCTYIVLRTSSKDLRDDAERLRVQLDAAEGATR